MSLLSDLILYIQYRLLFTHSARMISSLSFLGRCGVSTSPIIISRIFRYCQKFCASIILDPILCSLIVYRSRSICPYVLVHLPSSIRIRILSVGFTMMTQFPSLCDYESRCTENIYRDFDFLFRSDLPIHEIHFQTRRHIFSSVYVNLMNIHRSN